MNLLEKTLFDFLKQYHNPLKPLLLGISGGPDSLALLYLMVEYRKSNPISFAIAHVDHGWRDESAKEAEQLSRLAESLNVAFHLKRIHPSQLKGNLEAASRQERILFFAETCREFKYQAVIVAHHADDQAETVLKRLLESGNLSALSGLRPAISINGVNIWRPFLKLPKKTILEWLESQNLKGFEDITNQDPRFLRGRFRTQIIPQLSRIFGKEIKNNLQRIGEEVQELEAYLEKQMGRYLESIQIGKMGSFIDLQNEHSLTPFEIKYILRKLCERQGFFLSYYYINIASNLILARAANRQIAMGSKKINIDRGRVFIENDTSLNLPNEEYLVQPGQFSYGKWDVAINYLNKPQDYSSKGWIEVWQGNVNAILPFGNYRIGKPQRNALFRESSKTTLDKIWTDCKVPAFLRDKIPVVWQNDKIYHEFLTAKPFLEQEASKEGKPWIYIELKMHH